MEFELLSKISEIETFATGSGIREIARLRRIYGRGRWRKRRELRAFVWPMALFTLLNYTGMKRPGSDAKNSKSTSALRQNHAKATSKAICRLHQ